LYGVLVAIALSVADRQFRGRPHDAILGIVPDWRACTTWTTTPTRGHPRFGGAPGDAPLCFANAEDPRRRVPAAADGPPGPLRWFVLNVEANVEVTDRAGGWRAFRADTDRGAAFASTGRDLLAGWRPLASLQDGTEPLFLTCPPPQAYQDRTESRLTYNWAHDRPVPG
jgi:hypothetical protein